MTENQEKELFLTLSKLVSGVSGMQVDLGEIKGTLAEHTATLAEHTATLSKHSAILDEHTLKLDRLESKIDTVASQVIVNDKRTSSRIDILERAVEDLGGKVH